MCAYSNFLAGQSVDRFEVIAPLNRGGMGAVYVARDRSTGERVALKMLDSDAAGSTERFAREGRIVAGLAHPHIVACRGHGQTRDGVAWLAMELLVGEDLEARLARSPLPDADALALAAQLCDALEHAHARGVVHRDLKPSNVHIAEGARLHARVLDFGVARSRGDVTLTRTGEPVGTPSYMSPEQARGDRDVDARSDLWSVGVMLYECLAGRVPFQAGSLVGTLYQIVSVEPVDLARLRPDLPRALHDLVRRTLRKAREDRPSSAAALRAALASLPPLTGLGAPRARDAHAEVTVTQSPAAGDDELRLTAVACLDGARDAALVADAALALGGRIELLARGATLVLFGVERWSGDEPQRAVRLARAVAPVCRAVGVATGRVLRSAAGVAGEAIDAAAALAARDGVHLDDVTAALARDELGAAAEPPWRDDTAPRTHAAPFEGRGPELAALARSVRAATESLRTRSVVVLGPAGIGKSRLRREASARALAAEEGVRFVVLHCEALRRDAPFAALREALARDVDPGLADVFAPSPHATGDPLAALDRARDALRAALEAAAAHGPIVLVVDDAQWLDASSRATLRWVREQPLDLPLALWVFGRPEAADAATEVTGAASAMELDVLDRDESARLLRAVAGSAPEVLLDRAGGHPLFLEELGRMLRQQGDAMLHRPSALPPSVEGVHLAQLDLLSPAAREFLKRAAVFGPAWWVDAVAHLGGDPDALRALRDADLIAPRLRGRFAGLREHAFRAGVYQEVAYGLLPEAQRARLHARAAEWLAERPEVAPDELARHWALGGDRVRAALAYAASVEAAAAVADAATACAHAAHALELSDDPEIRWRALAARDDALQVSGDAALQGRGIDELEALAPPLGPAREAEAAWRRCYALRVAGDVDGARAAGVRAAALAAAHDDVRRGALVGVELALLLANAGRDDAARAHAVSARALAAQCDDAWLVARADGALAVVAANANELAEALTRFDASAAAFARAGDRRREALMRNNAAAVTMRLGRLDEATAQLDAAREASQRVGNAQTAAVATHNLGVIRRIQGDYDAARAAQDRADAEAARLGFARLASFVATERVWIALAARAPGDALRSCVDEALRRAEASRLPALIASARAAALRAMARGGEACAGATSVDEARALASTVAAEPAFDLRAALWELDGRGADEALASLDRLVAVVRDAADRAACRAALLRRYLVPSALAHAVEAT